MVTLILPLAVAWFMAVFLVPLDGRRKWVAWLAIAAMSVVLIATLRLAAHVYLEGPIRVVAGGWPLGVGISLRADALGVLFAVLTNGLLLFILIHEALGPDEERAFPALVMFLATGLTGLFLTGDAFNFYVFFEISMTTSFILATYGQQKREMRNAFTFTMVNLVGSAMFLAAIAALYHVTGTLDMRRIGVWVSAVEPTSVILIATIILVAFSVKLGLFPFHFWLPPVYRGVRPVVAAILSGVLANIGSYGLLRFGVGMFREELQFAATVLLILGVVSIVYGALLALSRRSASEVLAYSSISQAGYIMVGLAVGGPLGYTAVILFAIVNGLNKTLLFLATGLRGWLVGAAFVIGAFSVAGIPPAVGFFSKAALFRAGIAEGSVTLVALIFLGGALSFIYMFQIYQRDYWAQPHTDDISPPARRLLVFGLAGLVIALGLWPEPILAVTQHAAAILEGSGQ